MPGIQLNTVTFFDGSTAGSSSYVATLTKSATNVVIGPVSGVGSDVLTYVTTDLSARAREALTKIDADVNLGFSLDITDGAGAGFDPKITYDESQGITKVALYGTSTANFQLWTRDMLAGLILALDALGL